MSWIGIAVIGIITLFVLFQLKMVWDSKKMIGKPAPQAEGAESHTETGTSLLYFHSPQCGPCRAMTPVIEELKTEFPNVRSIDISQDLTLARQYNVRATPTVVLIKNGNIANVLLGQKSASKLRSLLEN